MRWVETERDTERGEGEREGKHRDLKAESCFFFKQKKQKKTRREREKNKTEEVIETHKKVHRGLIVK